MPIYNIPKIIAPEVDDAFEALEHGRIVLNYVDQNPLPEKDPTLGNAMGRLSIVTFGNEELDKASKAFDKAISDILTKLKTL
jgi:hypothetical protein